MKAPSCTRWPVRLGWVFALAAFSMTAASCRSSGPSSGAGGPAVDATAVVGAAGPSGDPVPVGAAPTEVTVPAGARATVDPAAGDPAAATLPATAAVGLAPAGVLARNVLGEPVRLDETASLACAHAEFALEALDGADPVRASAELAAVTRWGRPSANGEISAAAAGLVTAVGSSADVMRLDAGGFLAVCRSAGHL